MRYSIFLMLPLALLSLAALVSCDGSAARAPDAEIVVQLGEPTMLDEVGIHLTLFTREPGEKVALPEEIPQGERYFCRLFNTIDEQDVFTTILVVVRDGDDLLFIDRNNDNDLGNDSPPLVFSHENESVAFAITAPADPRQRVRVLLRRSPHVYKPELREQTLRELLDEHGNLRRAAAEAFGGEGCSTDRGRFYFDNRLDLRRGVLQYNGTTVAVGVQDYDFNGRYCDDRDLILVDVDGNGLLGTFESTEGFAIDQLLPIAGSLFQVATVDPCGDSLRLRRVEKPDSVEPPPDGQGGEGTGSGRLWPPNRAFWEMELVDIDGQVVRLADYRGRYLLLNIWGEWCRPCVAEIPAIVHAAGRLSPETMQVISFLRTQDLEKARTLITRHRIAWPQVLLDGDLARQLAVRSYPTNILVMPDGRTFIRAGGVDEEFFEQHIE